MQGKEEERKKKEQMKTNNLTIFTPTYNRESLLPRLYESLKRQTNKNFVWLVIDDGSTDNTEEVIKNWQDNEKEFDIEYYKKENGGKNTAIDFSNQVCTTEYIVCIDSDDYLTDSAVDDMYEDIKNVKNQTDVCGVVTRKASYAGVAFQYKWVDEDYKKIYFDELAKNYGYSADACLLFKTDIIKQFHFPKFEGEKFVTECVFYNQFINDYYMVASPKIYYLAEYQPDGYTVQGMKLFFKNPRGYLYFAKQKLYYAIKKKHLFKEKVVCATRYYAWKKFNKINDDYPNDYPIPTLYKVIGTMLSPIMIMRYKKKFIEMQK